MNFEKISFAIPFAIVVAALMASLWTGKTLGPKGTWPLIADRSTEPGRYMGGIAVLVILAIGTGWMAWEVIFNTGPS